VTDRHLYRDGHLLVAWNMEHHNNGREENDWQTNYYTKYKINDVLDSNLNQNNGAQPNYCLGMSPGTPMNRRPCS